MDVAVFNGVEVDVFVAVMVKVRVGVKVLVGLLATMVKTGAWKLPVGLFEQEMFNNTELNATIANKMTIMNFFITKPSWTFSHYSNPKVVPTVKFNPLPS